MVKILAVLTRQVIANATCVLRLTCNASFGGVILVSLSDSSSEDPNTIPGRALATPGSPTPGNTFGPAPIVGDFLALLSALFYALYVTLLKVGIREESRVDMQLFFGFVGLFNVLFSWPIGLLLHFAGVERFELPISNKVMVAILINVRIQLPFPPDSTLMHHFLVG